MSLILNARPPTVSGSSSRSSFCWPSGMMSAISGLSSVLILDFVEVEPNRRDGDIEALRDLSQLQALFTEFVVRLALAQRARAGLISSHQVGRGRHGCEHGRELLAPAAQRIFEP